MRNFYSNKVVKKPWGHEYVIYKDKNKIAITLVSIKSGHSTSLHCHPKKKTGFIILNGKASVQIGIYKKNIKIYNSLSRLVLRPGLFHSLKAVSKKGLTALEFETPYDKNDLVRFEDRYGREKKNYEGKKHTSDLTNDLFKFKKPNFGKKVKYKFEKVQVTLQKIKKFDKYKKNDEKSSTAILDGNIIDEKGRKVISFGEIVKTSTLKILSKKYKIKNFLTILNASIN